MRKRVCLAIVTSLLLLFVVGCATANGPDRPAASDSANPATAGGKGVDRPLIPVKQVTTWFAQAQFGGLYAARMKKFYEEAGLDVTIQSGGPGVSAVQIVASGQAEMGMTQANDVLVARDQGIPIIAIAATFQKYPQVLIYHKGEPIQSFADLNGYKVYTAPGLAYWDYLKKAYKLDNVQQMAYTGQLVNFISDKKAVNQGFVSNEPFALQKQGVETGHLLVADSGFNPYGCVIFTTEKYLREHPETVRSYLQATARGWEYYRDHAEEVNPEILKDNKDIGLDQLAYAAKVEKDFIWTGDALTHGWGHMSEERWSRLQEQMSDLGLIKKKED